MKKLIFAALLLIAVSCTERPDEPDYNFNQQQVDCGTVRQSGEESGQDFIIVQKGSETANNYNKYLVSDYMAYKLGSTICNFDGLTKVY